MTQKTIIISALTLVLVAGGALAKGHDQSNAVPQGGPFGATSAPEDGGQGTAAAAQANLGQPFGAARAASPGGFSGPAKANNPSDADE